MRWLITRARYGYLLCLATITIVLGSFLPRLGVEESNESMNAQTPAQRAAYEVFRKQFGDDALLVLSCTRDDLLSKEGVVLVNDLRDHVKALDGVEEVFVFTHFKELVAGEDGAETRALLPDLNASDFAAQMEAAILRNPALNGTLISKDRRTCALVIELETRGSQDHRWCVIRGLRDLIKEHRNQAELHLTGILVQKYDAARFIARDQAVVIPTSALVLTLVLLLTLRSFWGLVLPMLVTVVSLTWTLGLYAWAGYSLNAVTSLLPPVVMVLSIASSLHLYCAWRAADVQHPDPVEHTLHTMRNLVSPCFLTALTTAIGLASLCFSDTPAVRQFGIFSAIGVLLSFVVGITLAPVCFTFIKLKRDVSREHYPMLDTVLKQVMRLTLRHPIAIIVCAAILSVVCATGIVRIRNNTNIIATVKTNTDLYRDTVFIDQNLTGANSLEFTVERVDGKPLTQLEDMRRLRDFHERIARLTHVSAVISFVDVIKYLHRAEQGIQELTLPDDQDTLSLYFDLIQESGQERILSRVILPGHRKCRVSVRIQAIGTANAEPLVHRVLEVGRKCFPTEYRLTPTGDFYYMTMESNRLVKSQIRSFSLAFTLTMLAIGLIFRSVRFMLLALIPNLLPLVITAGVMGFAGIDFSIGTAMIASVVIGLAVDDTIHYLASYRRHEHQGPLRAIARSTVYTGRALIIASIVLVFGFWTGCLGSFKETIYFSLLTGATMVTALLCDLLVLPASLALVGRRRKCRKK